MVLGWMVLGWMVLGWMVLRVGTVGRLTVHRKFRVRLMVRIVMHGGTVDRLIVSPPPHSLGGVSLRAPPGGDWTAVG